MNQAAFQKYLPHMAVAAIVLYLGAMAAPRRDAADDWHYHDFGRLPVLDGGRYKPMDTVTRISLMIITSSQSYYDRDAEKSYSANKWMLDVMTSPATRDPVMTILCPNGAKSHPAWDYKVFRVENDELIKALDLNMRAGLRYSINELNHKVGFIEDQAEQIRKIPAPNRSLFQAKLMELYQHMHLCMGFSSLFVPMVNHDSEATHAWNPFRVALMDMFDNRVENADQKSADTVKVYYELLRKYAEGEKREFNEILTKHLAQLDRDSPGLMKNIHLEVFFNDFAPFLHCLYLYVAIALVGCFSWMSVTWGPSMRRAAFAGMVTVFLCHTAAIGIRMYLQGRAPVTNLYSSAIFIGWGCVLFSLIAERVYGNGIATVVGSVTGFSTLIIAHILSLDGDTMEMLVAVLDNQFFGWRPGVTRASHSAIPRLSSPVSWESPTSSSACLPICCVKTRRRNCRA